MSKDCSEWFAWFPVIASGQLVWLRKVERAWNNELNHWCDSYGYSGTDGGWVYREKGVK